MWYQFLRNSKRIPGKSAVLIVEFISSWGALFFFGGGGHQQIIKLSGKCNENSGV